MNPPNTPTQNSTPASPCKYCYGKGYFTRLYQEHGYDDFGGEGYISAPREERVECRCQEQHEQEETTTASPALRELMEEYRDKYNWTNTPSDIESFLAKTFAAGYKEGVNVWCSSTDLWQKGYEEGVKAGLMEAREMMPELPREFEAGCHPDGEPYGAETVGWEKGYDAYRSEFLARLDEKINS